MKQLVLDFPAIEGDSYANYRTFLCEIVSGEPAPGLEPECDDDIKYSITETRWFDLAEPAYWDQDLLNDPCTFSQLQEIRKALGFDLADSVQIDF